MGPSPVDTGRETRSKLSNFSSAYSASRRKSRSLLSLAVVIGKVEVSPCIEGSSGRVQTSTSSCRPTMVMNTIDYARNGVTESPQLSVLMILTVMVVGARGPFQEAYLKSPAEVPASYNLYRCNSKSVACLPCNCFLFQKVQFSPQ